tara:strand:+ start:622 stop:1929 length:1308 start_codon:yes stop_codon:yes gene_type:complete
MYRELIKKIKSKKIKVSIIGLGYVGLPLALRFIKSGIKVFGIDTDKKKILKLKSGNSYIGSIKNHQLKYFKKNKDNFSDNLEDVKKADVIIICLPTPLKKNKTPDMSYVFNFSKKIKKYIKDGQIIILESTVYPGATLSLINYLGLKRKNIGLKNFLIYSPERENPGYKSFNYRDTPKVVSGFSKKCINLGDIIYKLFVKKRVLLNSTAEAEATKLLENLYRSVNIGLVNEFKMICDKMNINVQNVIDAASTKNFGFKKFTPGPGLGGHCIPIDPYYLYWASSKYGYFPKFIKTSGEINNKMPSWVVNKIIKTFKKNKISFKNKKILLVGVAYKKNVDDDRETPAFEIMSRLEKKNIKTDYYDPFIPKLKSGRKYKYSKKSIKFNSKQIQKYMASLVITDHDSVDYKKLLINSKLVFDTRAVFKNIKNSNKIIRC